MQLNHSGNHHAFGKPHHKQKADAQPCDGNGRQADIHGLMGVKRHPFLPMRRVIGQRRGLGFGHIKIAHRQLCQKSGGEFHLKDQKRPVLQVAHLPHLLGDAIDENSHHPPMEDFGQKAEMLLGCWHGFSNYSTICW